MMDGKSWMQRPRKGVKVERVQLQEVTEERAASQIWGWQGRGTTNSAMPNRLSVQGQEKLYPLPNL